MSTTTQRHRQRRQNERNHHAIDLTNDDRISSRPRSGARGGHVCQPSLLPSTTATPTHSFIHPSIHHVCMYVCIVCIHLDWHRTFLMMYGHTLTTKIQGRKDFLDME
jgi:hypothetical protein